MSDEGEGTNRVPQTPSRRCLKISSEAESTTAGGNLFHGSTMRTGNANLRRSKWDSCWLSLKRWPRRFGFAGVPHKWGGSPAQGICYTPKPSLRAIGVGPMMVDPVCRAVVHKGNVRDLSLAESPASGDAMSGQCPSVGTAILPEWRTRESDGRG